MKSFASWVLAALVLGGCGYAPASHYARNVVGDSVSTEVVVSMEDPSNTVIIKDAVDTAVITKFRTSLRPKSSAKTHLTIAIGGVNFAPLQYDTNGYVITYRTMVIMSIGRMTDKETASYTTIGYYDFAIEPNAIITDQARFEAISQGAQKAIDAFIAQLASEGAGAPKED